LTHSQPTGVEPIAIVGMAARVPGAGDLSQFWNNLLDGVESVTFFDDGEQRARGASEAELADPEFVRAAPVLAQMEYFDAGLFGMTAREAELADPQLRIFLELAHTVLGDAACDPARYPGEIAVYAGSGADEYKWLNLRRNSRIAPAAGTLSVSVGNHPDYIATTVSYRLNLRGPSMTLHTACSTSLVAVHVACEALRAGECDMALAGGVCVELPHGKGYFSADGFTSSDGHCRPFDAKADGTIWGSGAGVVALKRLDGARADGDHIRAVILGNAVNNDGAAKVGFSAPSVEGQAEVIAQALGVAGIEPRSIGYVEAHGTGTALGDPIEVAALTRVYAAGTADRHWCGIGSVKSNFGHLSQAAGVVSLIKAALAVEHGLIPPTINFTQLNPAIEFDSGPFYVVTSLSGWDAAQEPRRAAVSSFGIGGTNAHVILEQAPGGQRNGERPRRAEVLRVSANTGEALAASVARLAGHLTAQPGLELGPVAHTLRVGRPQYPCRAFVVADSIPDAASALRDAKRLATARVADPAPGFGLLFSGQGSQYPGMGAELYREEPVFAAAVDECCELLRGDGVDIRAVMWPPAATEAGGGETAGTAADAAARLDDTRLAQPALFVIEHALATLWQSWEARPAAMIGHSIGEYVAATVAGVFTLPDALRLVTLRGRLMSSMPAGSMLAVQLDEDDLTPRLAGGVCLAAVNAPGMCVVAGPTAEVTSLAKALRADGIKAKMLRTSHAFHSPMMEPIVAEFTAAVAATPRAAPQIPFVSNLTGDWITGEQATDPRYWAAQLRQPVRFGRCVATLAASGSWVLVECGPGRQLAGLAGMQLPGGGLRPLPSLPGPGEKLGDAQVLCRTVGRLWLAGVPVNEGTRAAGRRVPLPGYPYERTRYWIEPDLTAEVDAGDGDDRAAGPATARPVGEWFAVPAWRQEPPLPVATPAGRFAVFAAGPSGEQIASALRDAGASVVTIRPGSHFTEDADGWRIRASQREDYDALLAALASAGGLPGRFVHAWALAGDPAGLDVSAAWEAQEHGFLSLLRLAQAIAAARSTTPWAPSLDVLVTGTEDVRGDDLTRPEHATTAGITRVVPLELRELTARRIDLDPSGTPMPDLLSELAAPAEHETTALRGGRRWVREFSPMPLPAAEDAVGLRHRGRYLITGGLGGIGLTLAAEFARRVQPRLVLLSRTLLPPREEWDSAVAAEAGGRAARVINAIRQMERDGAEVTVIAADVADPEAMHRAAGLVAARLGGLDGLIHAAGVPGAGLAEVKQEQAARSVLAPKLTGTLTVLAEFGGMTEDFVALCSSVTALAGGVGQADYCAANAFLDACARSASVAGTGSGLRARVVSLNWGGWDEVGMLAEAVAWPASQPERRSRLDHPLLTACVSSGGSHRCYGKVSASSHWVLDEHRIGGVPVLPGTAHLEAVRAAVSHADQAASAGSGVVLRDVVFLEPLRVPDAAELSVQFDGEDFRLTSGGRTFSVGSASTGEPGPGQTVDLAAIRARCRPAAAAWRTGRTSVVTFGGRWDCLRQVWVGDGEELALIEAPTQVAAELGRWGLHPALLDVATAFGMNNREGAYLPLSYGRVVVRAPLPARCYSYLRQEASGGGVLSASITICDEDGREIVGISDFTMRLVDPAAAGEPADASAVPASRPGRPAPEPGQSTTAPGQPIPGLARPSRGLIRPSDGADAFRRVIAAHLGPQVAITTVPVPQMAARIRRDAAAGPDPATAAGTSSTPARTVPPDASLEDVLAGVWADVLGTGPVGPDDDFFDLGGNSLVAVSLIEKVRKAIGVRLPMRILFQEPTVAGMASHARGLLGDTAQSRQETGAASEGTIPVIPRVTR